MLRRSLLALPALIFGLSCDGPQQATGLREKGPAGPSGVIADGAHGGNKDFFFLPPMVPPPYQDEDFERGKFNPRLQSSLKIEICQLVSEAGNAAPTPVTPCDASVPLVKTFAPGSVELVGVPSEQSGWWSNFNLPSDGFYKALWDTRQHSLSLDKYYRIKVFIEGSDEPLGYADVDPVSNMREWRHALTGEVVTMIDDTKLPIVFRVERGALCGEATQCGSATLTNDNPNGDSQVLQVLNEAGVPVAGVLVPDGWLPADGPQSVVFNIARVNTGTTDVAAGTQQVPCHASLPLQQFDGCFHFSTIPELRVLDPETGRQFATPIIGAVCFVLAESDDPRVPWIQLWSSEPDEEGDQPIPLKSADASAILTDHEGNNCGEQEIIADNSSNALTRFASAGWSKLSKGFGRVFGIKTAYAVDLGLGGILDGISNIGPALTAEIRAVSTTSQTVVPGTDVTSTVMVVGTRVHNGGPLGQVTEGGNTEGVAGIPVTFKLRSGDGTELPLSSGASPAGVTVTSATGGLASVTWTVPSSRDNYTVTATGKAKAGPVNFNGVTPPDPVLEFTGTELIQLSSVTLVQYKLAVTNHQAFPARMFVAEPNLGPCNGNANASRTRVAIHDASNDAIVESFCLVSNPSTLQSFSFVLQRGTAPPAQVYVKLVDRATGVTYSSNSVVPVAPPPALADLFISSGALVLTPSTITTAGALVNIAPFTVTNQGASFQLEGMTRTAIVLSTDATITADDTHLGYVDQNPADLEAGESFTRPPVNVTVPSRPAGTYYIGLVLDYLNSVEESDEGNNAIGAPLVVVAPPPPDLFISSGPPMFTSATLLSGGEISGVSASTLQNGGGPVPGGDTWVSVGLFLSTDPIITRFDWRFSANSVPRSTLVAGAAVGFGWGTLPIGRIPAGTYYLGVLADIDNGVTESNEGNNYVVSSTPVTVSWPELIVLNGDWRDESTGSTARLLIGVDGNTVSVQAWGDCSPTGCPWGTDDAQTSLWATEQKIVAVFETDIAVRTVTLQRMSSTRLAASMHFDYHDSTPDQTVNRLFRLTP